MKSVVQNLEVFKSYFKGEITIDDVEIYFNVYTESYINFENDFYSVLIDSSDEIREEVIQLLLTLNINISSWGTYLSQDLSVYNFLKELAKEHEYSTQLNQLIDLIAKRKWLGLGELLQSLAIAAIFILPVLAALLYPLASLLFEFLIKTANVIPILGILVSGITLGFNIYMNHLNDRRPSFKIYRDDIFLAISSTLSIAGKITLIVAKSMLASFAAFLFVAAAVVDTIKELFYLMELRKNYLNKPEPAENDQAIKYQQYARHEYDYIKQRNALIINLVSAMALTALVITCCFFPVGIILTLSACASIAAVYLLKKLCLYINENSIATQLQTELKKISDQYKTKEVDEGVLRASLRLNQGYNPQMEEPNSGLEVDSPVNQLSHKSKTDLTQNRQRFFKDAPTYQQMYDEPNESPSLSK